MPAQARGRAATSPAPAALPASAASTAHQTFTKYCVECHGADRPKGGLSISRAIEQMSEAAVGEQADAWVGIARMLETRQMPPGRCGPIPERRGAGRRGRLDQDVARRVRRRTRRRSGAGDRPPTDERRIRLRDPRSHRCRHQGRHRRLERLGRRRRLRQLRRRAVGAGRHRRALPGSRQAGRRPRRHRVGPAGLLRGSGQDAASSCRPSTGSSSSTRREGFRVVSGEGGRPFGFDRYAKAFYVAWHYRHRSGARRCDRHAPRARRPGGHHRPLRGAHLGRRQPGRHGLPEPADDRALADAPGADVRRPGLGRPGPRRVRRPRQGAGRVAELAVRARRPRRRRRRRREPARLRRHDARGRADARVRLSAEPRVRRGRLQGRPGPLDGAAVGRRAAQRPRRHSRGHLAQPARRRFARLPRCRSPTSRLP